MHKSSRHEANGRQKWPGLCVPEGLGGPARYLNAAGRGNAAMNILIISGFLGSGKTSALLQLGGHLVRRCGGDGRIGVMIIENEIGEVGVDDKLLRAQGLAVRELFSGCACCSSGGDLLADIRDIKEAINPDWILIEATGVAYPLQIKELIQACLGFPVKILSLADAGRWRKLRAYMPHLIEAQLDGADCILLNKADLVDAPEADAIAAELRGLNEKAAIYKVSANKPIDESVWSFL